MHSLKWFSLLKRMAILALGILLTACTKHSNLSSTAATQEKNVVPTTACMGNVYLQKYACSVQRIEQAAQSGDPDAQYALGYMYYYGIGTVRDKQTAILWISRSAKQGQPLAKKAETLIANGNHFHHLHRQGSGSAGHRTRAQYGGNTRRSSTSRDATRSANAAIYKPSKSVSTMNTSMPDKPLKQVLPSYHNNNQSSPKTVIKSLQKKSNDHDTGDSGGKVEPITLHDPRLSPNASPVVLSGKAVMTTVEARMMQVPKEHYTLQLMSGRNLNRIKAFIRTHHLKREAHYYSTQLSHKNWYMLVYGDFSSAARARVAVRHLPIPLRRLHPWVKSYRIVQDEIRLRRLVS